MNHIMKKSGWMTLVVLAGMAAGSFAAEAPAARGGRGAFGFVSTLEKRVGLSPEQRDAVRGLLAEQRQKSQAMRQETDGKIRHLLNSDQQKRFDDVLAEQKSRRSKKS